MSLFIYLLIYFSPPFSHPPLVLIPPSVNTLVTICHFILKLITFKEKATTTQRTSCEA